MRPPRVSWPPQRRRTPRYLRADHTSAPYSLLSATPPIFYVQHWLDERFRLLASLETIFEALADRRAYFLYAWLWWIEEPERIAVAKRLEDEHRRRYPGHRFVHLCNTERQWERFLDAGFDAVFSNHNCLVDERVFHPLPRAIKRFDAVYDARLKGYKRHWLALEVQSLALVYAFDPEIDDPDEVSETRRQLGHAHFFNHEETGGYRPLDVEQINRCLNACRVGLCLSQREGAMYASIQYLLAGLPVVSTASEGGRDVFFNETVARIVEDDPLAVRDAVAEWIRRDVPPDDIRMAALAKIGPHRQRFIDLVQSIYAREGIERRFDAEWGGVFFNKLARERQSHEETLRRIATADHP